MPYNLLKFISTREYNLHPELAHVCMYIRNSEIRKLRQQDQKILLNRKIFSIFNLGIRRKAVFSGGCSYLLSEQSSSCLTVLTAEIQSGLDRGFAAHGCSNFCGLLKRFFLPLVWVSSHFTILLLCYTFNAPDRPSGYSFHGCHCSPT